MSHRRLSSRDEVREEGGEEGGGGVGMRVEEGRGSGGHEDEGRAGGAGGDEEGKDDGRKKEGGTEINKAPSSSCPRSPNAPSRRC